jgi:hypothetical protein
MNHLIIILFCALQLQGSFALDIILTLDKCVSNTTLCYKVNTTNAVKDIQDALNTISKNKGGTLYLAQGTFNITNNFDMYANTSVVGDSMDTTIIRLYDFALPFQRNGFKKAGLIRSTFQSAGGCDNIVVANLTLDGNKENQYHDKDSKYGRYGLFTEACANVTFDGVRIHSMQGYGFDPHGSKPSDYAYNLTIVNCVAHDNDWDGFTLDQTIGVYVNNCTAFNNGRHGFNVVTGTKNTVISNVSAYDNGYYYYKKDPGCGIAMQDNMQFGTTNLVVKNAFLSGDTKGGFCTVGNVSSIDISNMTIYNADRCIHLAPFVVNATIYNIDCFNAKKFMVKYNPVNLIAFNNTMNGTYIKPFPTPSPIPKSPKSPKVSSPKPASPRP